MERTKSCLFALAALAALTVPAMADSLSGTKWQLIQIQSMDDSVDLPEDPSQYTLEFMADGQAAILADCNRGTGSWTSQSASQLQFGPIAATRALCPPGSLSDKYLAQFEWARSYVMENGHLFLATMADGSIIEFEPAGKVTATVFDEKIRATDAEQVQQAILTRLLDRYAADNAIRAEPAEIDALVEKMQQGMAEDGRTDTGDLSDEEAKQVADMQRNLAEAMIRQWKINRSLHEQFGGRIIYQQLGPEPLDAYRDFLRQSEENGAFAFLDPASAESFWIYFTNDSIHDFMKPGSDDAERAFSVPPWHD